MSHESIINTFAPPETMAELGECLRLSLDNDPQSSVRALILYGRCNGKTALLRCYQELAGQKCATIYGYDKPGGSVSTASSVCITDITLQEVDNLVRLLAALCDKKTHFRYTRNNRVYDLGRVFIIATMEYPLDLDGSKVWHSKVKQIELPYKFVKVPNPDNSWERRADRYFVVHSDEYISDFEHWLLLAKLV